MPPCPQHHADRSPIHRSARSRASSCFCVAARLCCSHLRSGPICVLPAGGHLWLTVRYIEGASVGFVMEQANLHRPGVCDRFVANAASAVVVSLLVYRVHRTDYEPKAAALGDEARDEGEAVEDIAQRLRGVNERSLAQSLAIARPNE